MTVNQRFTAYDFPPLKLDDFIGIAESMPKEEEVIKVLLPRNQVMLMAGDPWEGKSLELQHLTCGFGTSASKYHGFELKKCQSLYLTWEGSQDAIIDRFKRISSMLHPDIQPIIKLVPRPMPLNTPKGLSDFKSLLDESIDTCKTPIEVVLIDSFTYTFKGNARTDENINQWWENLQTIIKTYDITPIFSWELTKLIFDARYQQAQFSIERLKTASTTAYKVNTVVAIGEEKNRLQNLGHRLVVLKCKDSSKLEILKIKLDSSNLLYSGQHWELDNTTKTWKAVDDK